ncbi:MAG TPA: peptidoglycan DD-metalloendopeptidase family protein [Solirubrobacteraceae bacterium]|nr:peptidoglycan DD-metalloendopeptidase family protein [Solirubrobacteraceae bacterium]
MRPIRLASAILLSVGACAGVPAAAAGRGWLRPVDGPVLRTFSVAADRYARGQHRGIDLGGPVGARVRAACGGRVSFAGRVPRGGRTVSVRCGRLIATYQHLAAVAVRAGQRVAAGARIGALGPARPHPHVHLGARDAASGAYVDPLALFARAARDAPPPVALPARRRPVPLAPRRVPAPRPALPLTPRPAPASGRPLPLGRSPALTPVARRPPATVAPRRVAPRPGGATDRLPWPVWLGLALVCLGLPLGGVAHRRARRRAPAAVVRTAS